MLDELRGHSILIYNTFRTAKIEFPEENKMKLVMQSSVLAKSHEEELISYIEKIFCERCAFSLIVEPEYEEAGESKIRKNSEIRIMQEAAHVIEQSSFGHVKDEAEEGKSLAFAENPVTIVKKTSVFPERIEEKKYTKCFDCDKIKDGLVLRTRRSGDYLRVTAKGGKKKLKDYMIDAKIPKEERDSILLLADGQEIWWVVGYRRGESGRVGEDTKAVLQIQIGVGKEENR